MMAIMKLQYIASTYTRYIFMPYVQQAQDTTRCQLTEGSKGNFMHKNMR